MSEIKQLEINERDKRLTALRSQGDQRPVMAPVRRVQSLLDEGYSQIKASSKGKLPAVIVLYNNSAPWNWIDAFTVSSAMFGQYGVVLGFDDERLVEEVGRGYMGERRTTKTMFRSLSGVCVLDGKSGKALRLSFYHNPYATIRVPPTALAGFADIQYIHPDPHARGFVQWAPEQVERPGT